MSSISIEDRERRVSKGVIDGCFGEEEEMRFSRSLGDVLGGVVGQKKSAAAIRECI